jgi:hypothetical protein
VFIRIPCYAAISLKSKEMQNEREKLMILSILEAASEPKTQKCCLKIDD